MGGRYRLEGGLADERQPVVDAELGVAHRRAAPVDPERSAHEGDVGELAVRGGRRLEAARVLERDVHVPVAVTSHDAQVRHSGGAT